MQVIFAHFESNPCNSAELDGLSNFETTSMSVCYIIHLTKNSPTIDGTVWGPVSGHKRRKHVFRTSEGLQSAEINTESSFSIQETGVKLTAA